MEELYSETYVKAKPSMGRIAARTALILLCIILIPVSLSIHTLLLTVAILADGVIIFFLPSANIAYEYVFVDGQIDFDCIIGGSKRKHKKRTDLDKIEIVAPEDSHSLDTFRNLPLVDYSSGVKSDKHFIAVARTESEQVRIKFTPDEKMLDKMKFKARSKIEC